MAQMKTDMAQMKNDMATKGDMEAMKNDMEAMKNNMATKGDIGHVIEALARDRVKEILGQEAAKPYLARSVQDIVGLLPVGSLFMEPEDILVGVLDGVQTAQVM